MSIWDQFLSESNPGGGDASSNRLSPEQMAYFQAMMQRGGAPGGTPGAFGGAFGASHPAANMGDRYVSPVTIDHYGEDAGAASQLQGYASFNPGDWNDQNKRFMPGTSYDYYGTDGGFAGTRQTQTDGPDGIQKAVLAMILAVAGGSAYSEFAGAGAGTTGGVSSGVVGGGADVVVGGPMSVGGAVGTDLGPLAAGGGGVGAGAGALAGGGGGVEGTGAGLAGPASSDSAFNAALTDTAGGQGLASSDAAFNKALADAGLNQSTWGQIASKLGLPSGLTGSAATQILGGLLSQYAGAKGTSLANKIMAQSDPFAGYRAFYGGKLMDLEKNPTSISSNPGFAVGEDALKRSMASQGYNGSGNMATALSDYSAKYFMDERTQLAGLAGANATPGAGSGTAAQLLGGGLATQNNGWIQLLKGLGSGFDLSGGGNGSTGSNPVLTPSASGI